MKQVYSNLYQYLENFIFQEKQTHLNTTEFKNKTKIDSIPINGQNLPRFINEFWTSKQRQASSLHEIAYRACFKPQLPRFFINLFSKENDLVYDPFAGRGTTAIEAGLMERNTVFNDINPLSEILTYPRFFIPSIENLKKRLKEIPIKKSMAEIDLSMFFHPKTEREIMSLKQYFTDKSGNEDKLDGWIKMVATNRLTGHSSGFFSVYTLPPNQAVSAESQIKINKKRNQKPEYRNTFDIIIKKTLNLLRNITEEQKDRLEKIGEKAVSLSKDARFTKEIKQNSVQLTITSPPFLDVVQYSKDNWLRCWFNGINDKDVNKKITVSKTIEEWSSVMLDVFKQLFRITKPNGWVAFEVGEIKNGSLNLDEVVVPLGLNAGFNCEGILINSQEFTKTSNIWGVKNNKFGTNTNRIVLFRK